MGGIIGLVVLNAALFGSYLAGGGTMGTFIHAAPIEGTAILGAGIGGGNNAAGDGEDVTEAVGRSDADAEDIGCGSDAGCVA